MTFRVPAVFAIACLVAAGAVAQCPESFSVPQSDVTAIAVDQTHVYFTHGGRIERVPLEGGKAAGLANFGDAWVMDLALDDDDVYFLVRNRKDNGDSVGVIPKSGGTAIALLRGVYASAMVPDGEWMYVADPGSMRASNADGRIIRVKRDGSEAEALASGLDLVMGMLLDGDSVYFSEAGQAGRRRSGGVRRVAKSGGKVERLAKLPGAWTLTSDGSTLYAVHISGNHDGSISAISKSDGRVRQLVSKFKFEVIAPLHYSSGSLYFGNVVSQTKARLEAFNVADGTRRTIAEFEGGFPRIAVDRCGVYYSTTAGLERAAP